MPYLRPTLDDLHTQATSDLQSPPGSGGLGLLRYVVSRVLSWALANLAHGQYGYLDWIALQSNPFTATDEYLEAWAALVGILRIGATPAVGTVLVTGTPGALLPINTGLLRGDQTAFVTTLDARLAADGTALVPIVALVAGVGGNTDAGVLLTLSGVGGVNGTVTCQRFIGGTDIETDSALRARMLDRYSKPPQGGSANDYIAFAEMVPGVTRAWVVRDGMGPGTVVIYTMRDDAQVAHEGIPQGTDGVSSYETRDLVHLATGDQGQVADTIYPLQPVTALVYSVAPVAKPTPFQITSAVAIPAVVTAQVPAALRAVFRALSSPGGTIQPSEFFAALRAIPGMPAIALATPSAPLTALPNEIAVLGPVSYA